MESSRDLAATAELRERMNDAVEHVTDPWILCSLLGEADAALAALEKQAADAQAQLLLNNAEPPEQVKDSLREAHGMATYAELADRAVRFEEALQQIERPMPDPDADWTTVAPWRKVNNRRRDIARDALEGVKVDG